MIIFCAFTSVKECADHETKGDCDNEIKQQEQKEKGWL